jgi:hypothetical protein
MKQGSLPLTETVGKIRKYHKRRKTRITEVGKKETE